MPTLVALSILSYVLPGRSWKYGTILTIWKSVFIGHYISLSSSPKCPLLPYLPIYFLPCPLLSSHLLSSPPCAPFPSHPSPPLTSPHISYPSPLSLCHTPHVTPPYSPSPPSPLPLSTATTLAFSVIHHCVLHIMWILHYQEHTCSVKDRYPALITPFEGHI